MKTELANTSGKIGKNLADRLEERGLLERRADPADRRVKLLALTPAGETLIGQMNRKLDDLPGLAALSRSERQQLASLILRVLDLG